MMFKMKYRKLFIVVCILLMSLQQSSAIVGGYTPGVNEYWMMAGLINGTAAFVFCGGTILSHYYVLSAAHCVADKKATSLKVLVGDHDYATSSDTGYAALYWVQGYVNHPYYSPANNLNDITIIKTVNSIVYNPGVGPVCLPPSDKVFTDSNVQLVGWGTLSFGGRLSSVLQATTVKVVSNAYCYNYFTNIQPSHMCTYWSGHDSCQYDSGGPVYATINTRLYIAGIITFGAGCAGNKPSVNTRVTSFITWILQTTNYAVCY